MAAPLVCKVDFNVNDALPSVKALLDRLGYIARYTGPAQRVIDLTNCHYLGPDAAALLGAAICDMQRLDYRFAVMQPEGPGELRAFWRISGLQALLSRQPQDEPGPPPGGRAPTVMAIKQFRRATFNDADSVVSLARKHIDLSRESEEQLRICVNEVVQNIEDHSRSPIGGFMSARFVATKRQVRVAIVDRGLGICKTLNERYPSATPTTALTWVTRGDYTALSRPNNLGLGISNLWSIITRLHGEIFIVSDVAFIEHRDGKDLPSRLLASPPAECRYNGTGVFFSLPVTS
ncbi:MAG: hypothetical protein JXQ73_19055 [Phycisphaerae bacterium]|nr:hypothetical protein [Phycisphaerae bacterium]